MFFAPETIKKRIAAKHCVRKIEILAPTSTCREFEELLVVMKERFFYYQVLASPSLLFSEPFISFYKDSHMYAIPRRGSLERGNMLMCVPQGVHFAMDRETYQTLGITGKPAPAHSGWRGQRYDVWVDTTKPLPASQAHRLLWCLNPDRVSPVPLLLTRVQNGASVEVPPQMPPQASPAGCAPPVWAELSKCLPRHTYTRIPYAALPPLDHLVPCTCRTAPISAKRLHPQEEAILGDALEWAGLVACAPMMFPVLQRGGPAAPLQYGGDEAAQDPAAAPAPQVAADLYPFSSLFEAPPSGQQPPAPPEPSSSAVAAPRCHCPGVATDKSEGGAAEAPAVVLLPFGQMPRAGPEGLSAHRLEGMLPQEAIAQVMQALESSRPVAALPLNGTLPSPLGVSDGGPGNRGLVTSGRLPFACMTVWSFPEAPLAYGTHVRMPPQGAPVRLPPAPLTAFLASLPRPRCPASLPPHCFLSCSDPVTVLLLPRNHWVMYTEEDP
ncbi:putative ribonucleases P/MRP protein subunit RPP40 [Paratrimastix pyriformis]|uniref:Ribonucleases P/MRP protein subunit RPP40 n=1 Tax=Paratrimastix pyriformis TaxID=342808 RepID=A0ABQ8URI4_9EUKA|nr:putative ribonucleases P/MRP protein subunit RPP40 [Paratrimastix pyriformis]